VTEVDFRAWTYPLPASPLSGLGVSACAAGDATCAVLDHGVTDPTGLVQLHVPNQNAQQAAIGMNGAYLQIESGDAGPSVFPYLYFWGFPLSQKEWHPYYYLLTPSQFASFAASISPPVIPDPAKGHIFAIVYDCVGNAAPGVTVTLSNPAGATEVDINGTINAPSGSTGFVAFYNVSPGSLVLTATPGDIGKPASQVGVLVRKGFVTAVLMFPTPPTPP
jgi:hypothetical protein